MLSKVSRNSAAPALRPVMASRASANGRGLPETAADEPNVKKLGGLVLTRHLDESIMIGDEVEVHIVGLRSGTVRIKVVAPRSIQVHRREVFDEIRLNPDPARITPAPVPVPTAEGSTGAGGPRTGKSQGGLVLTRYAQQSIMIGDEVEIAIVEVRPTTVKLKISAPRTVPVHRREVYEALRDKRA